VEEEPGEPAVHDERLAGHRDVVLQLIHVVVDLVIQLGVQVQLQRGETALAGHLPVEVTHADAADAQPLREQNRHRALATAQITVEHDRPRGCHADRLSGLPVVATVKRC
jgi:hypothetical protein